MTPREFGYVLRAFAAPADAPSRPALEALMATFPDATERQGE